MFVAVHPLVADQSLGVVVVVQALKLKVGYHSVIVYSVCMHVDRDVWVCVHDMCVGVCILYQLTKFYLLSHSRT